MKKYLILILALSLTKAFKMHNLPSKITWLKNSDFKNGSYIISEPGIYRLEEDIQFNPPKVTYDYIKKNSAFLLGFFAAIIIQSDDVEIDLNGMELIQSMEFYLFQRFYAHIELGSSPFTEKFGPAKFIKNGQVFVSVKNVKIRNGTLGRSSHHGIHGNNCENVDIENVTVKGYEVAGISINGGKKILINHCDVGNTSEIVHVNGNFSAALQIKSFVEALKISGDLCDSSETAYLTVNGHNETADTILKDLEDDIDLTKTKFLAGEFDKIPEVFRNKEGLPDGSSIYGILLHSKNPANHGFECQCKENNFSHQVVISNSKIHNIKNSINERVFLQSESETTPVNIKKGQKDVRGTMLDILNITNPLGKYSPNSLSNAQLLVSKYKSCFTHQKSQFNKRGHHGLNPDKDTISKNIIKWANGAINSVKRRLVCNGDQMGNSIKGSVGLRLSGVNNGKIENLIIENIENLSPFGSLSCGDYENNVSLQNSIPGYLGADVRGVTVETSRDINFEDFFVRNLSSKRGKVIGVDVMFKTENINGNIYAKNLKAPEWKDLPEYFNKVPQSLPFATPLFITEDAVCNLKVVSASLPHSATN